MVEDLQRSDPQRVGPYRLVGRLGSGGMGRVFLGRSAGGRLVAVKVIHDGLAADPDFRVRFGREVTAAKQVGGLFTALVVDADADGPTPWLATAYVAGPSLADAVSKSGPLPPASVLSLAAGLAEGLAAIHAVGLVHRDLKPSNVLLAEDGPRVIDFGISRAAEASALTRTGSVIGSPGFMSPEQAEGKEVGPASDVFSLGAVLAYAATGVPPFGTGSTAALVFRVVFKPPMLDDVPWQVRPMVERCLAKGPSERPTPAELLAEFGDVDLAAAWLPTRVLQGLAPHIPPAPADSQSASRDVPPEPVAPSESTLTAPDAPQTVTSPQFQPEEPPTPQPPPAVKAVQPRAMEPAPSAGPTADESVVAPLITQAARSSARPPIRRAVAYTGTVMALLTGIGGVISQLLIFNPFYITAGAVFFHFLFSLAIYGLVVITALIGLTQIYRLVITGFLQGMLWLGAASLVTIIVLFGEVSYSGLALDGLIIEVVSLALGVIAAILLIISWSPAVERRPARQIRGLPLMLVGVAGLSQIPVLISDVRIADELQGFYYFYAQGITGFLVTLAVTWYAMSLRSRAFGGALVLGWATAAAAVFAIELAQNLPSYPSIFEPSAIPGYILLAIVVVLTIIYVRKPSDLEISPN